MDPDTIKNWLSVLEYIGIQPRLIPWYFFAGIISPILAFRFTQFVKHIPQDTCLFGKARNKPAWWLLDILTWCMQFLISFVVLRYLAHGDVLGTMLVCATIATMGQGYIKHLFNRADEKGYGDVLRGEAYITPEEAGTMIGVVKRVVAGAKVSRRDDPVPRQDVWTDQQREEARLLQETELDLDRTERPPRG